MNEQNNPLSVEERDTSQSRARSWHDLAKELRRILTPKGNIVEVHVPEFVLGHLARGVFGEGGVEALHVIDSACRLVMWCMHNPIDRKRAQDIHSHEWLSLMCSASPTNVSRKNKRRQRWRWKRHGACSRSRFASRPFGVLLVLVVEGALRSTPFRFHHRHTERRRGGRRRV